MKIYIDAYKQEFDLTNEQTDLVLTAVDEIKNGTRLFQYSAPAGCGKSVVLHAIIQLLGYTEDEIAPMAYMGSAAMIMRRNGFTNAKTCHSWLFNVSTDYDFDMSGHRVYKTNFVPRILDRNKIKLIVIDEGSMIPYELRNIIERNRIPVLVCGDLDQLQPIESESAYLSFGKVHKLTKIMRQTQGSSIVYLSNRLREGLPIQPGDYKEVLVIPYESVTDDMLLKAESIICGYNSTRDDITAYIRQKLGFTGYIPYPGEKVVCRENNWEIVEGDVNLVNGMLGFCVSKDASISRMKDTDGFYMDFEPLIFPGLVFKDIVCSYRYFTADHTVRKKIRSEERESPLGRKNKYNKFEFGYAITTHMSQGNQYKNGIYFEQSFRDSYMQAKLNYTGITRFVDHCIYVLPKYGGISMPPPAIEYTPNKCLMYINGQPQI